MPKPTRIVAWNIRAGGGKRVEGILAQLLKWRPDVIGLSEFRGTPASQWLAAELAAAGFGCQLSSVNRSAPSKNALLLASRSALTARKPRGRPKIPERWLLATVETPQPLTLGLMHAPNYTAPTLKYPFLEAVRKLVDRWDGTPGLIMGDTNCGKRGIDEANPSSAIFRREHDWIEAIETSGWLDAYRHKHGNRRSYTWYSHRNNGFRLDQGFCSPHFAPALKSVRHAWGKDDAEPGRRDALSDHAALIIDIELEKILKAC